MHGAVEANTNSSYGKMKNAKRTANIAKNYPNFDCGMEKQSTHVICIIYPEEHNGSILLTYEARSYQAVSLASSNLGPNNYSNPWCPEG